MTEDEKTAAVARLRTDLGLQSLTPTWAKLGLWLGLLSVSLGLWAGGWYLPLLVTLGD